MSRKTRFILLVIFILILVIAFILTSKKEDKTLPPNPLDALTEYPSESEIKEAIRYICNNYGIDYDCFNAIVRYESSYINQCNQTYGCIAGMGLTQIITPTALRCEEKLGREINPLKPKDALECGAWLLANEGTKHWGTEYTDWGSWEKWNTYCQKPLVVGFTEI